MTKFPLTGLALPARRPLHASHLDGAAAGFHGGGRSLKLRDPDQQCPQQDLHTGQQRVQVSEV